MSRMSLPELERAKARAAYGWESVEKDIALSTRLTVIEAGQFGRAYMEHTGIHPFDLVEWVCAFCRREGNPDALPTVIRSAFMGGILKASRDFVEATEAGS